MISASVSVTPFDRKRSPTLKSSKYRSIVTTPRLPAARMTALHHVIGRQLPRVRAGLDLDCPVMHVIARAQLPPHSATEPAAGMPASNAQTPGLSGTRA